MTNDVNKLWPIRMAHVCTFIRVHVVARRCCCLFRLSLRSLLFLFSPLPLCMFRLEQLIEEMETHLDETLMGFLMAWHTDTHHTDHKQ